MCSRCLIGYLKILVSLRSSRSQWRNSWITSMPWKMVTGTFHVSRREQSRNLHEFGPLVGTFRINYHSRTAYTIFMLLLLLIIVWKENKQNWITICVYFRRCIISCTQQITVFSYCKLLLFLCWTSPVYCPPVAWFSTASLFDFRSQQDPCNRCPPCCLVSYHTACARLTCAGSQLFISQWLR